MKRGGQPELPDAGSGDAAIAREAGRHGRCRRVHHPQR